MVSFETNPYPHNAIKTICREKKKRWVLCVSHQLQSVILVSFFFPLLEKGLSKKGKDWSGVSDFILKGASLYAERFVHHYKGTVHFYRECKRVVLSV